MVGAEETYISLAQVADLARLTGFPYFPISPTFPWLGLLGFVPLPTKWYIDFGEPIPMDSYGPDWPRITWCSSRNSPTRCATSYRSMIYDRLRKRRSVFLG